MTDVQLESAASDLQRAESAHNYGHEYTWGKAQEAFMEANKALIAYRKAGDMEGRKKALRIVVQAELVMGDTFDALRFAQDELAMITRSNKEDKKSRAFVLDLVIGCMGARGDAAGGLAQVQELVELYKELQDKAGQAKALRTMASLKIEMGQAKVAVELAEEALKLCRELKDNNEEEETLRVLNYAWCQKGQPDRAPGREEALRALEALANALKNTDQQAWSMYELKLMKSGAYNQSEFDDVIKKVLDKNPDNRNTFIEFLQALGIDASQFANKNPLIISEMPKRKHYLAMRSGGLSYGPTFRCLQQAGLVGFENEQAKAGVSVLAIDDENEYVEEWEKELQFNPGILDGMLQGAEAANFF